MSVAFRIRTQAGQELSFASKEAFEDFVRSGDLSPEDLVYDAETGSWSSALTNPVVLEIQYEDEEETLAESSGGETADADSDDTSTEESPDDTSDEPSAEDEVEGAPDLGLSLAPAQDVQPKEEAVVDLSVPEIEREFAPPADEPADDTDETVGEAAFGLDLAPASDVSPEEANRNFVEQMEAEREGAFDFAAGDDSFGPLTMENSGSMADMITASAPDPEPEPRAKPKPKPRRPRPRPQPEKSGGFGKIAAAIVLIGVLGGGGYFGYRAMGAEPEPEQPVDPAVEPIVVEAEPDPGPQPVIATTEAAVLERALERYLTASQSVLRNLEPVPEPWSTAEYFSAPSGHADVVGVWEGYLVAIREARAGDRDRYLVAFDAALDDAAIQGEERGERQGRALAAFDSASVARAAHFDRVEALASAAIQSHNALSDIEGLILIDATGASGIQSGIGRGAYGRDPDSQLLLDQVVDVLNATLEAEGAGPGSGSNVREWVWGGFLDAATAGS
ncbi:MAG: hypothetical protein AAF389_04405 [Gemmatimonadota bacterium]